MISKELLSEVLDKKVVVDDISNIELKENTITFIEDYWDEDEGSGFYRNHTINIYELANICKEWATYKGYELKSSKPIVSSDEGKQVFNYWWTAWLFKFDGGYESPKQILLPSFIGENEPKAIFKACQWILDNVKTNSLS